MAQAPAPAADRSHPLLEVESASVRFGGVHALDQVNLRVDAGEICGLIGPNGAGKTTLFNCVTRMVDLSAGTIRFAGARIDTVAPRSIIATGIARTFQNIGIYARMTVLENVMLGAHHHCGQSLLRSLTGPRGSARAERKLAEQCRSTLADLGLEGVADTPAGALPYASQKRLEIARALAARPKLLLLDEPAGGLTHGEVAEFADLVRRIRAAHGLTVLLVEHHMGLVMNLCNRLVVLHLGRNLASGTPAQVRANPDVVAAYLGSTA